MTTRKHPPPQVDRDDFGFEVIGHDWAGGSDERIRLLGLDSLARDLYFMCLKPFCDRSGDVGAMTYYRLIQMLTPVQSPRGGPRLPAPTRKQLRGALQRLQQAALITNYAGANMRAGALQIRVLYGVRGTPIDSVGAGVGSGVKRRAKPMLVRVH